MRALYLIARRSAPVFVALWVAAAAAQPAPIGPIEVNGDGAPVDWSARAATWYTSAEPEARKKQMRDMTRALKQPCRYCHTPDFTDYTDKKLISQQMMTMSGENKVACDECHKGKSELTPLGERGREMWAISHQKRVFCDHCHPKGDAFKSLTPAGEASREEVKRLLATLSAKKPPDADADGAVEPPVSPPAGVTPGAKIPGTKSPKAAP